jgi:DamX protein
LSKTVVQTNQDQNYRSVLGLKRDPFAPEPDAKFYYPFDSYEQRLQVLNHLVQGTDLLVLVIGESGSGKTSLLHRYLVTADVRWKTDQVQIDRLNISDKPSPDQKSDSYPIFVQQDAKDPIVIVDDAHKLPEKDLKFLLQDALVPDSSEKIKRLVLFGEPGLNNYITALSETTASDTAINKITMPVLTRDETESYLQYRAALAGHTGESLFISSVVTMIHKKSEGLPGRINEHADQWLKQKYAPKSKKEGMFTLLSKLPFKVLGWGVAALAVVVIGLFVLNRPDSTHLTSPKLQQASMRVFRAKIPAAVDSNTPEFDNRVTPKAQETTPRESTEEKEQPTAAEQPTTLARAVPQPVEKPQVKPPPIKPVIPKKVAAKNTIYRESWLLDQDSSYYTLQVLGVRKEESLLDFIKRHQLLQKKNVAYYKTAYKGKQWYPLLYGVYPTKSEAADAVKELPGKVQKSIPWIRKMSAVQKEVRVAAKR